MSDERETVIQRIRMALRDVPPGEVPEDVPVERGYLMADSESRAQRVHRFIERVREYKAVVRTVAPGELHGAICEVCAARGLKRLVVPADLPGEWIPAEVLPLPDRGLSHDELEHSDGVLTACALGIAQTGTIVLDSGPGQGRRAITLIPDYHLCVIREHQIVGLVPEAVVLLASSAAALGRPITLISGPSATSDIELNRVEGVHGPRTLEVLVVASDETKEPRGE